MANVRLPEALAISLALDALCRLLGEDHATRHVFAVTGVARDRHGCGHEHGHDHELELSPPSLPISAISIASPSVMTRKDLVLRDH